MLKLNYVGVVAAILAFVSLALPWWTISESGGGFSSSVSWYLWGFSLPTGFSSNPYQTGLWGGYAAMALVILSGILALLGSVMTTRVKPMLLGAGLLALLSLVAFVLGFSSIPSSTGFSSGFSLIFYSQSSSGFSVSAYLAVGYWLALVSGILSFIAIKTVRMQKLAVPPSTTAT